MVKLTLVCIFVATFALFAQMGTAEEYLTPPQNKQEGEECGPCECLPPVWSKGDCADGLLCKWNTPRHRRIADLPGICTQPDASEVEEMAKIRAAFAQVDMDQDGKIRRDQLMDVIRAMNIDPDVTDMGALTPAEWAEWADADQDNMLTAGEIVRRLLE